MRWGPSPATPPYDLDPGLRRDERGLWDGLGPRCPTPGETLVALFFAPGVSPGGPMTRLVIPEAPQALSGTADRYVCHSRNSRQ
jgi:hypothetical protein